MKNIFKYAGVLLLCVAAFASCEEQQDFQTTVDAPGRLAYLDATALNATINHAPTGTFLETERNLTVKVNTTTNPDTRVRLVQDNSLIAEYNEENETEYVGIPDGYVQSVEVTVTDGTASTSVASWLTLGGDLSALTNEEGYLVPLRLEAVSGAETSQTDNVVYALVGVTSGNIRPIKSVAEVFASTVADRSGWSSDLATGSADMFDGDATTYGTVSDSPETFTIDLGATTSVGGIRLMVYSGSYVPDIKVEYGASMSNLTVAGNATGAKYATQSDASGRTWQYIMFYEAVNVRYITLTASVWSNYRRVYEFDVLQADSSSPQLYAYVNEDNTLTGQVYHTPTGSTTSFAPEFGISASLPSQNGYTATVAVDNSLIATYNSANGTSYVAMPSSAVVLENATLQIPSMQYASSKNVKVSFSGLESLTDTKGYLVPLKITSSTSVRPGMDVVWLVVTQEANMLVKNPVAANLYGLLVTDRPEWTSDAIEILDGSTSTYVEDAETVVVNMGKEYYMSAIRLYNTSTVPVVGVEYSMDGTNYTFAGTADNGRYFTNANYQYMILTAPVKAKYIRLTLAYSGTGNKRLAEVQIYETASDKPLVYATESNISGEVFHTPIGTDATISGQFFTYLTMFSGSDVAVKVEQDNSLVSAYNEANGTSYRTVPAGNISINNATHTIPANKLFNSSAPVSVSLTGDLSALDDLDNGYIVPLKVSSGNGIVTGMNVVYAVVNADYCNVMSDPSTYTIFGTLLDRTGWTSDVSEVVDNSTSTAKQYPEVINIDMGAENHLSGLRFYNYSTNATYAPNRIRIEYSLDGVNYEYAGVAVSGRYFTSSNNQYMMFYDVIKARHLRLTVSYSSTNANNRIAEVYAYDAHGAEPAVFVNATGLSGTVVHTPVGSIGGLSASFNAYLTAYSQEDVTATVALDNSLVAAYNTANGTSYGTIPAANIKIDNANQLIRAGLAQSLTSAVVSLTGNLSALTDTNGYVVPLTISDASAGISQAYKTVYVVVKPDWTNYKYAPSSADITGTLVEDKTGWSVTSTQTITNIARIIDGTRTSNSYASASASPCTYTVDLGQEYKIGTFRHYGRALTSMQIEYSTDGINFTDLGTADSASEYYRDSTGSTSNYYFILYSPVTARYVRMTNTFSTTTRYINEFDIYAMQ